MKALLWNLKSKIVTCFIHPNVLTQFKTSFKNFVLGSPTDAKKKIFRPVGVIDFLARIRFTLWTSEVMSHRMLHCSGVAMLTVTRADHKNASSFHSSHLLTTIWNERKSCIMLIITIRNNKLSSTLQSNTHKLKRVLFLILDDGSCLLCLFAALLIINFPIFTAFA